MRFSDVTAWIQANPVLFSVVIWPTISALVLAIFKPRTPADYAKMNPRLAGFFIFLSGIGFDPAKMLEGLKRALTGNSIPISAAEARDTLERSSITDPVKPATNDPDATIPPPTTDEEVEARAGTEEAPKDRKSDPPPPS